MSNDLICSAAWWTPTGWLTAAEPEPHQAAAKNSETLSFQAMGYSEETRLPAGEIFTAQALHLSVRHHPDGHSMFSIEVGDFVEQFFVRAEHLAAFWIEKAPATVNAVALQGQVELLSDQVRTLAAYVRHGHGPSAIDQQGAKNREEREAEAEWLRQSRRSSAERAQ